MSVIVVRSDPYAASRLAIIDVLRVSSASCGPVSASLDELEDVVVEELRKDDKSESRRSRRAWMMDSAPLDLVMYAVGIAGKSTVRTSLAIA